MLAVLRVFPLGPDRFRDGFLVLQAVALPEAAEQYGRGCPKNKLYMDEGEDSSRLPSGNGPLVLLAVTLPEAVTRTQTHTEVGTER